MSYSSNYTGPQIDAVTGIGNGETTTANVWTYIKSTLKSYFDSIYQAAGSYLTPGGALGTPSSGTLTNCTFPTLNQNTTGTAAGLTSSTTSFAWKDSSSCVAGTWLGSNGSGGSYWMNMPSLSASFPSCLGVYGSYSGGITTINIGGYGVYSSGYGSVLKLNTSSATSTVNNVTLLSNGNVYNYNNSASWDVSSDQRVKENIREIGNALDKVCQLHPVHFEYINKTGETHTGFIAQEFETVLPGHVTDILCPEQYSDVKPELAGETIKSITPDLAPYLVKAIQELKAEIDVLKGATNG